LLLLIALFVSTAGNLALLVLSTLRRSPRSATWATVMTALLSLALFMAQAEIEKSALDQLFYEGRHQWREAAIPSFITRNRVMFWLATTSLVCCNANLLIGLRREPSLGKHLLFWTLLFLMISLLFLRFYGNPYPMRIG